MNTKQLFLLVTFFSTSLYAAEQFRLRRYKNGDKKAVSKLLLSSKYLVADHKKPKREIAQFLNNVTTNHWWSRNYPLVCVNSENVVVGFVNLPVIRIRIGKFEYQAPDVFVERLVVDEQYRRQGIAQKMLNAAVDYGSKKHKKSIALTAENTNISAIALYEKFGFIKKINISNQIYYEFVINK